MERAAFFLPNRRCPHRCIYCDQGAITGETGLPAPDEIRMFLQKFTQKVELCFFGGSFTCLDIKEQRSYLDTVFSAPTGSVVRFSTHPLCISEPILALMKEYPVSMIELGISSLNDNVLKACRRGYDYKQAIESMKMVISHGFRLGAQMMIGLPFQDEASSLDDIDKIAAIGKTEEPITLRIYPCLVIRNTVLEQLYINGLYKPLGVKEAAVWSGNILYKALHCGMKIQRIGLQETESLSCSVAAGPHHPALGEMARSQALALDLTSEHGQGPWEIPRNRVSLVKGHHHFGLKILSSMAGLSEDETLSRIIFV